MITRKITFILGAGASMPFRFPSGKELVNDIHSRLSNTLRNHYNILSKTPEGRNQRQYDMIDNKKYLSLFEILRELNHSPEKINRFNTELIKSQLNSIDAFLEHRIEYIEIGKLAIAHALTRYENERALYDNPDWYNYIWNKMNAPYEMFTNHQLAFITFNYDRSLEHYLMNGIQATYGKSIEDSKNLIDSIPIIHVHGKLGSLPWEQGNFILPYGHIPETSTELKAIASNIKIIHEDIDNDPEFKEAHYHILKADQVVFLGFGYWQQNMDRLKINEMTDKKIMGTNYGLTPNESYLIRSKFTNLQLGDGYNIYKILEYLRNNVTLN